MQMSYSWKAPSAVRAKLRREGEIIPSKIKKALSAAGEVIIADAKMRTPVDTGLLRANVNKTVYDVSPAGGKVNIAFLQEYAPYVHERLELKHTVGEAKFLENALKSPSVKRAVNKVFKAYLGY